MRIGQNPAKSVQSVEKPEQITVIVVSYIPFLGGYYSQSLDILKLCLQSLREHADLPFDLMVFDNASCDEVRDYLVEEQKKGRIQYLVLSDKNVGKVGAWNYVFGAAPGEYLAYADSDVYFYPNWLSGQIEVLETFPNIGMVTGIPMLTPEKYSTATVEWAEAQGDIEVERGKLLPWEDFWRHTESLGGEEEKARKFYEENDSIRLTRNGKSYYVGAAHFQFVAKKQVLQEIIPLPSNRPMGEVRKLDEAINQKGYLRLTTDQWYVKHMGNRLPDGSIDAERPVWTKDSYRGLARITFFRKILRWVHDKSFKILYRR